MIRAERSRRARSLHRGEARRQRLGAVLLLLLSVWRHPEPRDEPDLAAPARDDPEAPRPAPAPLEGLLWVGCEELEGVLRDGEPIPCRIESGTSSDPTRLRVWLPSSVTEPVVALDGTPSVLADAARVDGGWSLLLQPDRGGRLTVSGKVDGAPRELLVFDLRFRPSSDAELRRRLDAAVGNRAAQAALVEELRAKLADAPAPEARLLLARYLQYALFDLGEARASAAMALEVAELAHGHGQPLLACASRWSASYLHAEQLGDARAAAAALVPACGHQSALPGVAMMGAYYEGLVELQQGGYEDARRLLERSALIARRVRWPRWEIFALNPLIEALAAQGRFEWARQALERMHELDVPGRDSGLLDRCESQARNHRQRGDLAMRELELLGATPVPPRVHWLRAREIQQDRAYCPEHPSVAAEGVLIDLDLARAALEDGDPSQAAALLAAIPRRVAPVADVRRRLLRAELALARGNAASAWQLVEQLADDVERGRLADAAGPEDQWRLHLLRARVHQARGELRPALDALARAQARLDAERTSSPGVESDRHAAMRRRSSQLMVRLLLDHGLVRPALCAARVARARGLAGWGTIPAWARPSLQAAELQRAALYEGYAWYDPRDIPVDERMGVDARRKEVLAASTERVSPVECDQLPAPSPGEASLLYHHDGRGWVAFAWDHRGRVAVQRLPPGPEARVPAVSGEVLLAPLAQMLEEASRLRVLVPPVMQDLGFADLAWQGRPLGEVLAVAHAIDLPRAPAQEIRAGTAALVFSDPRKVLMSSHAALEPRFAEWRARLEAHGLDLAYVVPPSRASGPVTVRDVVEGTRGVELAVLYGFGVAHPSYYDRLRSRRLSPEPDQDGFGVGHDVLTRGDVLLGRPAPRHVILAHCDSATVDPNGLSGVVGLAQSYVQAGAEWAIGAMGDVDPRSMETIVDMMLEAYRRGSQVEDVAAALQRAKQRLASRGLPDGERLRLWVP